MKRSIKSLISIMLVLVLALSLAGCGNAGSSNVIELRVLNYFSIANPGALEEVERVWDAFEAAHPNIKLIREDEFEEPFHFATEAHAAAGTLPDVIYCWPSGRSSALHTNRLLKDLAPLVARDNFGANFNSTVLNPDAMGGGYLAMIPNGVTATHAFYVNLEVLESVGLEPAKTYSELVAQVPILREAGYETILMANEATWVMQSCLMSAIAGRFAGEGWEKAIHAGTAKFTDPDFVAAIEFIERMYVDGVLDRSTVAVDYGSSPGLFATNRAAYMIDGDWRVGDFITDAATGQVLIDPVRQEKILITVFPEIDLPGVKYNANNSVVLGTGWGLNANLEDGSDKLEAAWTLLKWLVGKEVLTFRVDSGGLPVPSRTDIDLASLDLEPMQVAVANLGQHYNRSNVVIDAAFDGQVYTPLNDGLQALGLGTITPMEVAQNVQNQFEAWKAAQ
ncbi:MAG: extracellular solute-binding protein [Lachnospiraceae bacterium]|nr:extracellular solute-binding protein [Lachnospiraceae bacterium]